MTYLFVLAPIAILATAQVADFPKRRAHILWPTPGLMYLSIDLAALAALAGASVALAGLRFWPISIFLLFLFYGYGWGCRAILPKSFARFRTHRRETICEAMLHQLPALATMSLLLILISTSGCGSASNSPAAGKPSGPPKNHADPGEQAATPCHPTIHRAILCTQALEDAQQDMELTLASMKQSLDTVQASIKDKTNSTDDIRGIATELIEMSDTLADQYEELVASHKQFELKRADAPQIYRDAGRVWREYGIEERRIGEPEIAKRYDEIAQLWDATASTHERTAVDPFSIAELNRVMIYVGRSRLLLTRLLSSAPVSAGDHFLQQRARFVANLQEFIARFDQLRATILGLTQRLQEDTNLPEQPGASQAPIPVPPVGEPMPGRTASTLQQGTNRPKQPEATPQPTLPTPHAARMVDWDNSKPQHSTNRPREDRSNARAHTAFVDPQTKALLRASVEAYRSSGYFPADRPLDMPRIVRAGGE